MFRKPLNYLYDLSPIFTIYFQIIQFTLDLFKIACTFSEKFYFLLDINVLGIEMFVGLYQMFFLLESICFLISSLYISQSFTDFFQTPGFFSLPINLPPLTCQYGLISKSTKSDLLAGQIGLLGRAEVDGSKDLWVDC